jgi:hypothetical protein
VHPRAAGTEGDHPRMKKAARSKATEDKTGASSILRSLFRTFSKFAEQAGDGRPLLRGLRVAYDPKADRIVIVHGGARIEFVLRPVADTVPAHAQVECRRMDSAGKAEAEPFTRFRYDEQGVVAESNVAELVGENVAQAEGAWSIVAAVVWDALQAA